MTDREKLIELLNENFTEYCNVDIIAGHCKIRAITFEVDRFADFLISNGVTFRKWIPVSERLPEVGTGNVLVARSYKGKPYVDVGEFINGTACCWGDEYAINPREHITTHWMPLPNPPKEEDK